MRKILPFFIFLIIWIQISGAQSIITIEVQENGNALWNMEKRIPLINRTEIDDWEEFIKTEKDGDLYQKEITNFRKSINWFLLSAQEFSNRKMQAENFKISYNTVKTPSNTFGIIKYSFEWKSFSRSDSGKIFIGDSFSEGMVLSSDNVLVIKIPDGYDVTSVSPGFDKQDGDRLIWDGTLYRNFGKGEPTLVLSPGGDPWILVIILAGLTLSATAIFLKRKRKSAHGTKYNAALHEDLKGEDLDYEEMIERFLVRSGGQASQSDVIKEIGISKSRVSTILAQMKDNGQIIKIKKGKENLIRLNNPN